MTLDEIRPDELAKLWAWINAEPHLHLADDSPKTLEAFVASLANENITVVAARTGKKLIGAIGFDPAKSMLRGIHFIPEVRGTVHTYAAVKALLETVKPAKVTARYLSSNKRVASFLRKLGAVEVDGGGSAIQNGVEVPLQQVIFTW
jgi:hypothetical protein